jgi:hypothetical protein
VASAVITKDERTLPGEAAGSRRAWHMSVAADPAVKGAAEFPHRHQGGLPPWHRVPSRWTKASAAPTPAVWRLSCGERGLGVLNRQCFRALAAGLALAGASSWPGTRLLAQELEPRRWSHLPTGQNFASIAYAHTAGDIAFDPVLGIEDAKVKMDTMLVGYVRSFALLDHSARIEVRQAWQHGRWNGLVNGVPTEVTRDGASDTFVRLAFNLVGGPPLTGKAYAEWRAAHDRETIVGAAIGVQLPTGHYLDDKLINLGSNRFTLRPQLGVQHRRRNWTFELTAMAWIYSDNSNFFGGNRLAQDPFYSLDGTIIYTFKSGLWASASGGVGVGGRTAVNGRANSDRKADGSWAASVGVPLNRALGIRINYGNAHRWRFVGNQSRTLSLGLSASWR